MEYEPLFVAKPDLPPLEALQPYLERIWSNRILTNGGPIHQELERNLEAELGVSAISLFANGTLALVTALQALRIHGEVITTPFSFVATCHSILWNGLKPVFVDVDPHTGNLDPAKIESAITPRTSAILAVHVYGTPCDTLRIQEIAYTYGLKVIYDASHAFGVEDEGGSVLRHGNLSTLSFHATKVFNTFEGGAVVEPNQRLKTRIDRLKNFGFVDEVTVADLGVNAKLNELQAAIGLLQLQSFRNCISHRKAVAEKYEQSLAAIPGITFLQKPYAVTHNYSYVPMLVDERCPISRDELCHMLCKKKIFVRRYFFPLISEYSIYKSLPSSDPYNLPVATDLSRRVICLPTSGSISSDDQQRVIDAIAEVTAS
jgi:dTDP-4-amino-4,6-dideoxygalactose transaminase